MLEKTRGFLSVINFRISLGFYTKLMYENRNNISTTEKRPNYTGNTTG